MPRQLLWSRQSVLCLPVTLLVKRFRHPPPFECGGGARVSGAHRCVGLWLPKGLGQGRKDKGQSYKTTKHRTKTRGQPVPSTDPFFLLPRVTLSLMRFTACRRPFRPPASASAIAVAVRGVMGPAVPSSWLLWPQMKTALTRSLSPASGKGDTIAKGIDSCWPQPITLNRSTKTRATRSITPSRQNSTAIFPSHAQYASEQASPVYKLLVHECNVTG